MEQPNDNFQSNPDNRFTSTEPPPTSPPPQPGGNEAWRTIVTLLSFLFVSPIIGIIVMWAISGWSKRMKIIVTIVVIVSFIILFLAIAFIFSREKQSISQDARIISDVKQYQTALRIYEEENGAYPDCPNSADKCFLSELNLSRIPKTNDFLYKPLTNDYQISFELSKALNYTDLGPGENCAMSEEMMNESCDDINE